MEQIPYRKYGCFAVASDHTDYFVESLKTTNRIVFPIKWYQSDGLIRFEARFHVLGDDYCILLSNDERRRLLRHLSLL
jgi:hypothetical protein